MGEHEGRVAIVLGGSQGIGRATAIELARQGAAVVVHGLTIGPAVATASEVRNLGVRSIAVSGDIGDAGVAQAVIQAAVAEFGGIDTLVTSAGIQRYGDVVTTTPEVWEEVLRVNVTGTFLAVHEAMPHLRRSATGSVVIVASVQATATQSDVVAYTASKGALVSLARAIAVDEAPRGVRVNSISPGSVDTPMLRSAATDFSDGSPAAADATVAEWGASHPIGRVARPDEIAAVISFVASPRASFVAGEDIRVDGGLLARLPVALPQKG